MKGVSIRGNTVENRGYIKCLLSNFNCNKLTIKGQVGLNISFAIHHFFCITVII